MQASIRAKHSFATALGLFLAATSTLCGASEATFPRGPVRIIVPLAAGGGVDAVTRLVAKGLAAAWGQPVNVENRDAQGGVEGTAIVASAAPDGHTLLASSSAHVVSAVLRTNLPYDPLKDFAPVAPLSAQSYVLVVGKALGVKNVSELIARMRVEAGQAFTSAGVGSGTHLMAERFNLDSGIRMSHMPTAGAAAANEEVSSGRIAYWFSSATPAMPFIRDGRLVALAVSGPERMKVLPDVPTVAESGLPGFSATLWYGVWAPAATSRDIVERIAGAIDQVLRSDEVRTSLGRAGAEPLSMAPVDFGRFVREEAEAAARVVKAAGLKAR